MKEIVNAALRRGLAAETSFRTRKRFRVEPRSLGLRAGIDARRLNQLLDDLDVKAFAAKARVKRKRP